MILEGINCESVHTDDQALEPMMKPMRKKVNAESPHLQFAYCLLIQWH